jgi:hypothetical protein
MITFVLFTVKNMKQMRRTACVHVEDCSYRLTVTVVLKVSMLGLSIMQ